MSLKERPNWKNVLLNGQRNSDHIKVLAKSVKCTKKVRKAEKESHS